MIFSSPLFVTLFLPIFLALYYLTPVRLRNLPILLASYSFYGWWRVDFLCLLIGMSLFNYGVSQRLTHSVNARRWLWLGISGNVCILGYFKYFNFGVESFNHLIQFFGAEPWSAWSVILPIGISFYIFQAISYLVDIYRKDASPAVSYLEFSAFMALFPQLIAGPVIRFKDIARQFQQRRHSWQIFNEGCLFFALGFCQKVLIADSLAPLADKMFALSHPTLAESWLGIFAYAMQLYFDFSGYSHMAIGLGLMMGFRFIQNFNHPYVSCSITEFWRRWHISLSQWLKDYVYIPLGGNRHGDSKTYRNLMLTMLLGGLWHGANWTFLLWGFWHGLWLTYERKARDREFTAYPLGMARLSTLLIILLGWVLFRSDNLTAALHYYLGLIGLYGVTFSDAIRWQIPPLQLNSLWISGVIAFFSPIYCRLKSHTTGGWAQNLTMIEQLLLCSFFVIAYCKLVTQSYTPFLYFQF